MSKIINGSDIHDSFEDIIEERHEMAFLVFVDTECNLIERVKIGHGCENLVLLSKEKIVKEILEKPHKYGIILVHNHPFASAMPSSDDNDMTKLIENTCEFLGRKFIDHIIVAKDEYYSYQTNVRTKYVSKVNELK